MRNEQNVLIFSQRVFMIDLQILFDWLIDLIGWAQIVLHWLMQTQL